MNSNNVNIWNGLNFEDAPYKSAYDYLNEQSKPLAAATRSELKMEVERVDSYLEGDPIVPVALCKLFVVAPRLGNFRRKLITVVEGKYGGNFPVDVYSHIDDFEETKVTEEAFLRTINEIVRRPVVQASIINLYRQSTEIADNNMLSLDVLTSNGMKTIYWFATPFYLDNSTKGWIINDIHGYDFPEPYWGKLLHIYQVQKHEYVFMEDSAQTLLNKPLSEKTDLEKDLSQILEKIKIKTIKRTKH